MATTLFLRDAVATIHPDDNDGPKSGGNQTGPGFFCKLLSTDRGPTATSGVTDTVAGPTVGIECKKQTTDVPKLTFISEPVSAGFTLSGTITFNLRALESDMMANVAINAVVEKIDRITLQRTVVVDTTNTTELGTSESANNFTATPTSTAFSKGDRIMVTIYGDDSGSMGSGFTFTLFYDGPTGGASGDSWIELTETVGFISGTPAGTEFYLTNVASIDAGGLNAAEYELQLSRGSGVVSKATTWYDKWNDFIDPQNYIDDPIQYRDGDVIDQQQTVDFGTNGQLMDTTAKWCAQSFVPSQTIYVYLLSLRFVASTSGKTAVAEIRTDSGSDTPSGTVLGTTVPGSVVGTGDIQLAMQGIVQLTGGTKYWIVVRLTVVTTGTLRLGISATSQYANGSYKESTNSGSSWSPVGGDAWFRVHASQPLEWYSKPLNSFTLSDFVEIVMRVKQDQASSHFSARAELAIVDADGSNPVLWGRSNFNNATLGEMTTAEVGYSFKIAGADTPVGQGKRLRLRLYYVGDSSRCSDIFVSGTVGWGVIKNSSTLYWNGTSAGASGDSRIRLTQTVTEAGAAAPGPALGTIRRRSANRFLATR